MRRILLLAVLTLLASSAFAQNEDAATKEAWTQIETITSGDTLDARMLHLTDHGLSKAQAQAALNYVDKAEKELRQYEDKMIIDRCANRAKYEASNEEFAKEVERTSREHLAIRAKYIANLPTTLGEDTNQAIIEAEKHVSVTVSDSFDIPASIRRGEVNVKEILDLTCNGVSKK